MPHLGRGGLISGCTGQGTTSDEGDADSGASRNSAEQAQADTEGSPDEDSEGELAPVDVSSPVHGSSYVAPFVEVFGDVRVGENSDIEQRTAIRADEGTPIIFGARASIEDRVTFHALKVTDIRIGDDLTADDDVVLHGPLVMGDGISVEDDAVVFRVVVEDAVEIGEGAIIAGPEPEEENGVLPCVSRRAPIYRPAPS